jgi:hypothetical protein
MEIRKSIVELAKRKMGDYENASLEAIIFNNIFEAGAWFQSLAWYTFVSVYAVNDGHELASIRKAVLAANEAVDKFNEYKKSMGYVADVAGQFDVTHKGIVIYYSGSGTPYFFVPDRDSVTEMVRIKNVNSRSSNIIWTTEFETWED